MENFKLIKKLLLKGLCLKVIYFDENKNEKFLILADSTWVNKLKIYDVIFKEEIILDIFSKKEVIIEKYNISSLEYVNLPNNFILSNLDEITHDNNIIKNNLKVSILHYHLNLNEYLAKYGLDKLSVYKGKKITTDKIIISTYPNHQYYLDNFSSFEEDIVKNYFYVNLPTQPINDNDLTLRRCFNLLNISYENKDITDEVYISSMRKVWDSIILEQKEKLLENLKREDFLSFLSDEEKKEYSEEIEIYNEKLSKNHFENLNKLKTIKEIISYWPTELQPIPDFVYYEY